jgi:predicted HTH transcriptional regulator
MTKLTKKVALSYAVATLTDAPMTCEFSKDEIVAKLTEMIDGLDKKSTGEKKLTDQQVANLGYKTDILAYLADGQAKTATEILKGVTTFPADMSNQRVSQLLRQLILDGKVSKDIVKGKAMFKVAEGE